MENNGINNGMGYEKMDDYSRKAHKKEDMWVLKEERNHYFSEVRVLTKE